MNMSAVREGITLADVIVLSAEQHSLLGLASKCPVHRTAFSQSPLQQLNRPPYADSLGVSCPS
jgi:hypothetical protein